jgi:hypothetical protein
MVGKLLTQEIICTFISLRINNNRDVLAVSLELSSILATHYRTQLSLAKKRKPSLSKSLLQGAYI